MILTTSKQNKETKYHKFVDVLVKVCSQINTDYTLVISSVDSSNLVTDFFIGFQPSKKKVCFSEKISKDIRFQEHLKGNISSFFKNNEDNSLENIPNILIVENETFANKIVKDIEMETKTATKEATKSIQSSLPRYKLENVILNNKVREDILSAITIIKFRKKIYQDWGFEATDKKPKLILNFFGPPGTGKTMCAHGLAEELGKKILLINYSDIESKYVGDAPKNLVSVFENATKENSVLFFDEADSFLGKRIESVSSSSDQSINSLRSQMLILLEEFEGVVLFATNLVKNYDKAFESRILKHINFELPNRKNRRDIISQMIPTVAPLQVACRDTLYDKLSSISKGFSGREIKNAILESFTKAAYEESPTITEDHLINGFKSCKKRMKSLNDIKPKISPKLKAQIESKIKSNLNK